MLVQYIIQLDDHRMIIPMVVLFFCYKDKIVIGYVTYLDYSNNYISPYNEFERFKSHT